MGATAGAAVAAVPAAAAWVGLLRLSTTEELLLLLLLPPLPLLLSPRSMGLRLRLRAGSPAVGRVGPSVLSCLLPVPLPPLLLLLVLRCVLLPPPGSPLRAAR